MILLVKLKDPKKLREVLQEALDNGALDSSTIAQELEQMIPELMGGSKFFNATKSGKFETVIQGTTSDNILWLLCFQQRCLLVELLESLWKHIN